MLTEKQMMQQIGWQKELLVHLIAGLIGIKVKNPKLC
jgi:hypothetical protein